MVYHFNLHKEKKGYWADCIELDGCNPQGETIDELKNNLQEVLDLYFDEAPNSNILFPEPKNSTKITKNIIKIPVNPNIAFSYLLRKERIKNNQTY